MISEILSVNDLTISLYIRNILRNVNVKIYRERPISPHDCTAIQPSYDHYFEIIAQFRRVATKSSVRNHDRSCMVRPAAS